MIAFQIRLNGKKACQAGIGADGVLSTTITFAPVRGKDATRLYVGGLIMPKEEHVRWKQAVLRVGDEVRVKVIQADTVDKPSARFPRDRITEAKVEKRQLRFLARKFGWKLCRPTKRANSR